MSCDHKFVYAGMRYADGVRPRPGSGARNRYYAHMYFCERFLEKRGELVRDIDDSTYEKVRFDATPASREEVGVPNYDRDGVY